MELRKWFVPALTLGLILALTPITALAWPGQSSFPHFSPGFTGRHQMGNTHGWRGQRSPGFRQHRPFARGQFPYQRFRYGRFHGNQNFRQPWMMGQSQNYGVPYASPGFQSFPFAQPYGGNQGYGQPYMGQPRFGGMPFPFMGPQANPYAQQYPYPPPSPYYGQSQDNQDFGPPNPGQPQYHHGGPYASAGPQGFSHPGFGGRANAPFNAPHFPPTGGLNVKPLTLTTDD